MQSVQESIDDDFMVRFKELCEQYETGYSRHPLLRVSKHNKTLQVVCVCVCVLLYVLGQCDDAICNDTYFTDNIVYNTAL